ncbi:MAG: hypothetical protein A3K10_02645 [Bacteroidetes bacterium RIFCSPLOWO2_12_FULL_31_6]|nr:MAG: hypothetical protein A3K10_02645 [Bacteroidetes bacterium RIFCSPLOWO2_12_FULL_31_6]
MVVKVVVESEKIIRFLRSIRLSCVGRNLDLYNSPADAGERMGGVLVTVLFIKTFISNRIQFVY